MVAFWWSVVCAPSILTPTGGPVRLILGLAMNPNEAAPNKLVSRIPSSAILHPNHKYSFNLKLRAKKLGHNLVSAVSKLGHT